jgi:hypothetical protein
MKKAIAGIMADGSEIILCWVPLRFDVTSWANGRLSVWRLLGIVELRVYWP